MGPFKPRPGNARTKGVKRTATHFKNGVPNSLESSPKKPKTTNTSSACNKKIIKGSHENVLSNPSVGWQTEDAVAEEVNVDIRIVEEVINLLDDKFTIPFIARYRKNVTQNLEVKQLIHIAEVCEKVRKVEKKIETSFKTLKAKNVKDVAVHQTLRACRSSEEISHIMAPYKEAAPRSLADRALKLGLGTPATKILQDGFSVGNVQVLNFINPSKGLNNKSDVFNGIKNIITSIIAKDLDVIAIVRRQSTNRHIWLCSEKNKAPKTQEKETSLNSGKIDNFSHYYDFKRRISQMRSHQVLAINRGEKLKQLKVTIDVPNEVTVEINELVNRKWMCKANNRLDKESQTFLSECSNAAITRYIKPLLCRIVRKRLSELAETESVDVFMENLKNLLLTPPLKGETILAIDPGFKNGCKVAITSINGEIIDTHVIFPLAKGPKFVQDAKGYLIRSVVKFGVKTIAIGNGKGCRQVESFVADLIQKSSFKSADVRYCIISEQGISIHSVSDTAAAEMPDLDPTVRSAVSLAKRLQNPLAEYIKVDPKHLGVGMYQHDVSQKKLEFALDTVTIQCVSFVGVDLNTSGEHLLKKVSGLNIATAKNIVEWRKTNGNFQNREQLMFVKGIGAKIYEQCAGFVKILPETCQALPTVPVKTALAKAKKYERSNNERNPLDMTGIHPESYPQTLNLFRMMDLDVKDIGSKECIRQMDNFLKNHSMHDLCDKLQLDEFSLNHIIDNLKHPAADIRAGRSNLPIFRQSIVKMSDINVGDVLTGQVSNVTNFGSFVDIGVDKDGLIHTRNVTCGIILKIGHTVKVEVIGIDIPKQHISLKFLEFIP